MSLPPSYPLIEGFWLRNYKAFHQIAIGSSFQQSLVMDFEAEIVPYELTPITLFVGDAGTGKSTILDAFALIADCINDGVDHAVNHRGGFDTIYHHGGEGPISFGIVFRPCAEPRSLTYILNIDRAPKTRHPFIETEAVIYRDHEPGTQPQPVLFFQNGIKTNRFIQPWVGCPYAVPEQIKRTDAFHLALPSLADFEDLPDIPVFKRYLDNFFVSYYASSNAARLSPPHFKRVPTGNLALDLKRVKEKHPLEFQDILNIIAQRMKGIETIQYEISESGRAHLLLKMKGQDTVIYPAQLGEGHLRLLALLTLFEDPIPVPLLGIEEPAAFMGHTQIKSFVQAIQNHVQKLGGSQFFITTSNNILIDQMDPTEVWLLTKDENGSIQTLRGLDALQFRNVDLDTVGPYWYTDYIYRDLVQM